MGTRYFVSSLDQNSRTQDDTKLCVDQYHVTKEDHYQVTVERFKSTLLDMAIWRTRTRTYFLYNITVFLEFKFVCY